MKILHVIDRIGVEFGGSAEVCRKQTKYLQRAGHEVTTIASDAGINGYVPDVAGLKVLPTTARVMGSFHITPSIKNIDFSKYDVIHLHNYTTYQNLYTLHHAGDTPIVWQPHGAMVIHDRKFTGRKFYSPVSLALPYFQRLTRRKVSKIICVSDIELKQVVDFYPGMKTSIIPNGIDDEDYDNLPPRGEFRKLYGIPNDANLILNIGRDNWMKNISALKECYRKYFNNDKYYLALVGTDMPPLYGRDKLEAYVDANVFVLPSLYEIYGLTPLEALACGTPVVVSDKAGIAPFIDEYVGIITDIESCEDLALSISSTLAYADTVSNKERQQIAFRRRWDKIIPELVRLYESLGS